MLPCRCPAVETLESRLFLHADGTVHAEETWRINAGGSTITISDGRQFRAETSVTGGAMYSTPVDVAGTTNDRLYYERRAGSNFSYDLPVYNGTYTVRLYFLETYYTKAGQRKFDVKVEGQTKLNDFDIVSGIGYRRAGNRAFDVSVTDGHLNIALAGVVNSATLSAIEVTPKTQTTPPPIGNLSWSSKKAMPGARAESSSLVIGGRLWVFGGYYTTSPLWQSSYRTYSYDPATDLWREHAAMPAKLSHTGTATDGRYAYLAGGYLTKDDGHQVFAQTAVYRYDTHANTWNTLKSLPAARGAGAMAYLNGKLHFFGGLDASRTDKLDHWVLDLANPNANWTPSSPLPAPRNHMAAVTLNGSVYLVGGQSGETNTTIINRAEVYRWSPGMTSWQQVASLPVARSHVGGSTFVYQGRIYTAGGITNPHSTIRDVSVYDPATNKWSNIGLLPEQRHSGVGGIVNGKFVYAGGYYNGLKGQTWVALV
jgi:N-acetylneuraminic acid mutarotase